MMRRVIAVVVLSAAALWAQSVNEPKLPVINQNACPFECCQFGTWTATADVPIYGTWQRGGRKQMFAVKKGEVITALTGVHITYKPGRLRVLKDIPELNLRKGQIVDTFMRHGEGDIDFWATDKMQHGEIEPSDSDTCSNAAPLFREMTCTLDDGDKEWWIQIKTKSGRTGWVDGAADFDGADACG